MISFSQRPRHIVTFVSSAPNKYSYLLYLIIWKGSSPEPLTLVCSFVRLFCSDQLTNNTDKLVEQDNKA